MPTREEVFASADIDREGQGAAAFGSLLRKGQLLFTYLHLAASKPLTESLMASGATCIAYETVEVTAACRAPSSR